MTSSRMPPYVPRYNITSVVQELDQAEVEQCLDEPRHELPEVVAAALILEQSAALGGLRTYLQRRHVRPLANVLAPDDRPSFIEHTAEQLEGRGDPQWPYLFLALNNAPPRYSDMRVGSRPVSAEAQILPIFERQSVATGRLHQAIAQFATARHGYRQYTTVQFTREKEGLMRQQKSIPRMRAGSTRAYGIAQAELLRLSGVFGALNPTQTDCIRDAQLSQLVAWFEDGLRTGEPVPSGLWWRVQEAKAFMIEREAYVKKRPLPRGPRSWHRLRADDPEDPQYDKYITEQAKKSEYLNRQFVAHFSDTPQSLASQLSVAVGRDDVSGQGQVCSVWPIITMRARYGDDPIERAQMSRIIDRHHVEVKQALELYVAFESLPLFTENKASMPLQLVALDSLQTADPRLSVFTPDFGSVEDDRRRVGKALQAGLTSLSLGYNYGYSRVPFTLTCLYLLQQKIISVPQFHKPYLLRLLQRRAAGLVKSEVPHGLSRDVADWATALRQVRAWQ